MAQQYQYRVTIDGQEHLVKSDHELTPQEIAAIGRKPKTIARVKRPSDVPGAISAVLQGIGFAPEATADVGRMGAATAIGMAGPAAGAAAGGLAGPLAPVAVPLGAMAGSYAARKANVALGLETPGEVGDIVSVGLPAAGYAVGPILRGISNMQGGLAGQFGRGAAVGGLATYLTGDPKIGGIAAGAAAYIPELVRMAAQSAPGRQIISLLAKTGDLMGPAGFAALLGFLRETGQLELQEEPPKQ